MFKRIKLWRTRRLVRRLGMTVKLMHADIPAPGHGMDFHDLLSQVREAYWPSERAMQWVFKDRNITESHIYEHGYSRVRDRLRAFRFCDENFVQELKNLLDIS